MLDYSKNYSRVNNNSKEEPLIHKFNGRIINMSKKLTLVATVLIIVLGVLTGYLLSVKTGLNLTKEGLPQALSGSGKKAVGSADIKTFKDSAEGELDRGGINGEGTHKLIRPGGKSQTVYLTSSVLNLDEFVGKKVKVWGETFSAEKAGWLMDVGRLEILE